MGALHLFSLCGKQNGLIFKLHFVALHRTLFSLISRLWNKKLLETRECTYVGQHLKKKFFLDALSWPRCREIKLVCLTRTIRLCRGNIWNPGPKNCLWPRGPFVWQHTIRLQHETRSFHCITPFLDPIILGLWIFKDYVRAYHHKSLLK